MIADEKVVCIEAVPAEISSEKDVSKVF